MPYQPTEKEKLDGLDHVHYEIQQLLGTMVSPNGNPMLDNAVLESRLLHIRNLLDFFARKQNDRDDILATHYGFRLKPIELDPVFVERLNKDLAHLTYSRTQRAPSARSWPCADVLVPTLSRCKEFVEHILVVRSTFGRLGLTDWRGLGLRIQEFLCDAGRLTCP